MNEDDFTATPRTVNVRQSQIQNKDCINCTRDLWILVPTRFGRAASFVALKEIKTTYYQEGFEEQDAAAGFAPANMETSLRAEEERTPQRGRDGAKVKPAVVTEFGLAMYLHDVRLHVNVVLPSNVTTA